MLEAKLARRHLEGIYDYLVKEYLPEKERAGEKQQSCHHIDTMAPLISLPFLLATLPTLQALSSLHNPPLRHFFQFFSFLSSPFPFLALSLLAIGLPQLS